MPQNVAQDRPAWKPLQISSTLAASGALVNGFTDHRIVIDRLEISSAGAQTIAIGKESAAAPVFKITVPANFVGQFQFPQGLDINTGDRAYALIASAAVIFGSYHIEAHEPEGTPPTGPAFTGEAYDNDVMNATLVSNSTNADDRIEILFNHDESGYVAAAILPAGSITMAIAHPTEPGGIWPNGSYTFRARYRRGNVQGGIGAESTAVVVGGGS